MMPPDDDGELLTVAAVMQVLGVHLCSVCRYALYGLPGHAHQDLPQGQRQSTS